MLTIIGVGPGNPRYLMADAVTKIVRAEHILGFGRVAKSLYPLNTNIVQVNRVDEILEFIEDGKETVLLASGDPNFYGIVEYIKSKGIEIKEVFPGLTSFQYLMGKLKKSWHNAIFISLHGRNEDISKVKDNRLSIILTDEENNPNYISQELKKLGVVGKMYIGFNLSYIDEEIVVKDIGDEVENISSLAVVVIEVEMD